MNFLFWQEQENKERGDDRIHHTVDFKYVSVAVENNEGFEL